MSEQPVYDNMNSLGLTLANGLREQQPGLEHFIPLPVDVDGLSSLNEALQFQLRLHSISTGGEMDRLGPVPLAHVSRISREAETMLNRTLKDAPFRRKSEKLELLRSIIGACETLLEINGGVARDRVLEDAQLGGWDSEQGEAEETTGLERFLRSEPLDDSNMVDELEVALRAVGTTNPKTRLEIKKIKEKLMIQINSRQRSASELSVELQFEQTRRAEARDNLRRIELDQSIQSLMQQLAFEEGAIGSLKTCLVLCNKLLDGEAGGGEAEETTGFEIFLRPDAYSDTNTGLLTSLARKLRKEIDNLRQNAGEISQTTRRQVMQIKGVLTRKIEEFRSEAESDEGRFLIKLIFNGLKKCIGLCDYLLDQGAGGGTRPA